MPDAGRVIAGTARGTRLAAAGAGTRSLGDRVKQTLFAILEPSLPGRRTLDLFAGSGAAGIEALSRGSTGAVFVDQDAGAIRAIRENLERCRFDDAARIVRADVLAWLERDGVREAAAGRFGLIVVDPPYDRPDILRAVLDRLGAALSGDLLAPDALVVAKSFWRDAPPAEVGLLASERTRRFGETALTIYRRREAPPREA